MTWSTLCLIRLSQGLALAGCGPRSLPQARNLYPLTTHNQVRLLAAASAVVRVWMDVASSANSASAGGSRRRYSASFCTALSEPCTFLHVSLAYQIQILSQDHNTPAHTRGLLPSLHDRNPNGTLRICSQVSPTLSREGMPPQIPHVHSPNDSSGIRHWAR